jgi:hypothetical protein
MNFIYTDGGRTQAGFYGTTGDCVTRAIAVATEVDYKEVYDSLFAIAKNWPGKSKKALRIRSNPTPRSGVYDEVAKKYLEHLGWVKVKGLATLDSRKFQRGTYICKTRKHFTVVKDGALYDAFDCSMTSEMIDGMGDVIPSKVRTAFHHYIKAV